MLDDLKDLASVLGINVAALAVSLSEIEQTIRIITAIAALIYTLVKTYKLIQK